MVRIRELGLELALTNQATRAAILGASNSTDYALLCGSH